MNPQSTLSAWMALLGMVVLVGLRGGEGGGWRRGVMFWYGDWFQSQGMTLTHHSVNVNGHVETDTITKSVWYCQHGFFTSFQL